MAPRTAKAKKAADVKVAEIEVSKKGRGKAKNIEEVEQELPEIDIEEKAPIEKKKRGKKAQENGDVQTNGTEEAAPPAKRGKKKNEPTPVEEKPTNGDISEDEVSNNTEEQNGEKLDENGDLEEPVPATAGKGKKKAAKKDEKPKEAARGRKAKQASPEAEEKETVEEKPKGKGRGRKPKAETKVEQEDDKTGPTEEVKEPPTKGKKKGKAVKEKTPESDKESSEENSKEPKEDKVEEPKKETKGRKGKKAQAKDEESDKESYEENTKEPEEDKVEESKKETKGRKGKKAQAKEEESDKESYEENTKEPEEDKIEEPKKETKGRKGKKAQVKEEESDKESYEENTKELEEDKVEDPKKETKARKGKKTQAKEEEGDEPKEEPASKKRKVNKKEEKGKGDSKDDEEVMNDDSEEAPEKPKGKGGKKAEPAAEAEDDPQDAEPTNKRRRKVAEEKAPAGDSKKKAPPKNKAVTNYDDIDFSNSSKTPQGKEWNFKIASWNVDGIRAWMSKGGLDYIKYEKPDILCLQEVKCSRDKLPEELANVPGYHAYWLCSDKDGYAGVGVYTTELAMNVQYGLQNEELDDEGRIITAEYEQFYLICTYVPNAGRKLVTLPKRLQWNEEFRKYVKELDKKKPVIICGDMNVAHHEIDLSNPKSNKKNAGFTPEERAGMSELLGDGFVDTFRHFYPDRTSAYTFWTYMMNSRAKNVGWRLDYFIVSERLLPLICDNVIRDGVYGSDHCPISMFLHLTSADKPKEA